MVEKNITDNDDFGFSFETDFAEEETSKVDKMYKLIEPLLDNLAKNPDNPMIKWPNRAKEIEHFKEKLKSIKENK